MNKRLKLFSFLTLFCVLPLVLIGWVSFNRLQQQLLSDLEESELQKLSNISLLVVAGGLNGEADYLVKNFDKMVQGFSDNNESRMFLTDQNAKIVTAVVFDPSELSAVQGFVESGMRVESGEWVKKIHQDEKIVYQIAHRPMPDSGLHLFSVIQGGLIESQLRRLKQLVLIYCAASIIAAYAAGFLVYAYFTTQAGILRTFIERFESDISPVPESVPVGEYSDVCLSFRNVAGQTKDCEEELTVRSITDSLTGAYNKNEIMSKLNTEISKAKRYSTPLSALIFDIDRFSRINDSFGYDVGDQVLCRLTAILHNSLRDHDIVGRFTGDVFLVILPLTDLKFAANVADRIRAAVEVSFFGDPELHLTVTGAVGHLDLEKENDILSDLETLLFQAKRKGRNRVEGAEVTA